MFRYNTPRCICAWIFKGTVELINLIEKSNKKAEKGFCFYFLLRFVRKKESSWKSGRKKALLIKVSHLHCYTLSGRQANKIIYKTFAKQMRNIFIYAQKWQTLNFERGKKLSLDFEISHAKQSNGVRLPYFPGLKTGSFTKKKLHSYIITCVARSKF